MNFLNAPPFLLNTIPARKITVLIPQSFAFNASFSQSVHSFARKSFPGCEFSLSSSSFLKPYIQVAEILIKVFGLE